MKKYICDFCFKEFPCRKDLRKIINKNLFKCKECRKNDKEPEFSCYIPFQMEQATLKSGSKLIGVKSPQGQFIALNKVLEEFMKPFRPAIEFVCHIQNHISQDPKLKGKKVVCKFCDKSIDEIWDESEKQKKQKEKKRRR